MFMIVVKVLLVILEYDVVAVLRCCECRPLDVVVQTLCSVSVPYVDPAISSRIV